MYFIFTARATTFLFPLECQTVTKLFPTFLRLSSVPVESAADCKTPHETQTETVLIIV